MTKSSEELKQLKEEYISLSTKLKGLSPEELKEVTGGFIESDNSSIIPVIILQNSFKDTNKEHDEQMIGD